MFLLSHQRAAQRVAVLQCDSYHNKAVQCKVIMEMLFNRPRCGSFSLIVRLP